MHPFGLGILGALCHPFREDFLSNISHELRTPVNVVNGMSDLLDYDGIIETIGKKG